MRRREVIRLLGVAAGWPGVVSAQAAVPVVGYLSGGSATGFAIRLAAFRRRLQETGYRDGKMLQPSLVGRRGETNDSRRWRRTSSPARSR
jgi:hypothetical protein